MPFKSQGHDPAELRRLARSASDWQGEFDISSLQTADVARLLYECGVYQAELLAQNEELRELRAELEHARDLFAMLYDRAPMGYAALDHKGNILTCNAMLCDLLACTRDECIGAPLLRHIAPEHRNYFSKLLGTANASPEPVYADFKLQRDAAAGEGWVRLEARSTDSTEFDVGAFLVAALDITDRIRTQNDLDAARREADAARDAAERADRAKSEFLASMSHEIRTPMNGVLGMLQLMEEERPGEPLAGYLEAAGAASHTLLTIINDILDLSRIEAGRLEKHVETFRLRRLLQEVVDMFAFQAKQKGLELTLHVDDDVPEAVTSDGARVRQILFNLVGNAMKFTASGAVSVNVRCTGSERYGDAMVAFEVADTGPGIPEDSLAKLFHPFARGDSPYTRTIKGTGLGLAIVRRLTELLGGEVELDSVEGEGTRVRFTLPLASAEPHDSSPGAAAEHGAEPESPPATLRLLLAEDDRVSQLVMRSFAAKRGHSIEIVSNGQEVLDMLDRESFDVVLMDMQMPVMDGLEALRHIRAGDTRAPKDLPVVAMTAFAMPAQRDAFLEAGAGDILVKPVDFSVLDHTLRAHAQGAVHGGERA